MRRLVFIFVVGLFFLFISTNVYAAPGDQGDACRQTSPQCNANLECNGGVCTTPCGGTGQACCQTTDPSRLCDPPEFDPIFQDLICQTTTSNTCELRTCGTIGEVCCRDNPQCQGTASCVNNICAATPDTGTPPIATNTATLTPTTQVGTDSATLTPTTATQSGQILVPDDPNAPDFFSPDMRSIIIQVIFVILTLLMFFSLIR